MYFCCEVSRTRQFHQVFWWIGPPQANSVNEMPFNHLVDRVHFNLSLIIKLIVIMGNSEDKHVRVNGHMTQSTYQTIVLTAAAAHGRKGLIIYKPCSHPNPGTQFQQTQSK